MQVFLNCNSLKYAAYHIHPVWKHTYKRVTIASSFYSDTGLPQDFGPSFGWIKWLNVWPESGHKAVVKTDRQSLNIIGLKFSEAIETFEYWILRGLKQQVLIPETRHQNAANPLLKSTNFIWTGQPGLVKAEKIRKENSEGVLHSPAAVSVMANWGYHSNMELGCVSAEHHCNQTGLFNTHIHTVSQTS